MAKIKPEFDKRNVKILGLSVDPLENHKGWAADIEETQGTDARTSRSSPTPTQGRRALRHAAGEHVGRSEHAHAADNMTVRNVFIIGPTRRSS